MAHSLRSAALAGGLLVGATAEPSRPAVAVAGRVVRVSLDSGVAHALPAPAARSDDPRVLSPWPRPAAP